jgi:hypothetical protein
MTKTVASLLALGTLLNPCRPITVRVWDRLPLEPETSERARTTVDGIFRRAGVEIHWKDCAADPDPTCSTPGVGEISLRIFRRPDTERRRTGDATGGMAVRQPGRGGIVQVFYDRLEEAAAMRGLPMDLVLAATAAHEIGHLLLSPGHSRTGIMRADLEGLDWHRAAQGWLGFSAAETATMREAVCGPGPVAAR